MNIVLEIIFYKLMIIDYYIEVNPPKNGFNPIGLFQQYQIYDHAIHYYLTEEQTNREYKKALL